MDATFFLKDEAATLQFAKHLASVVQEPLVIFLSGEIGAGKTTLSRGFLHGLGYVGKVKSPTYTLVETYEFDTYFLHHFDFYRVMNKEELNEMGLQDYFVPHAIILIEWPEKGADLLPQPDLACFITTKNTGREIKMVAYSSKGEAILQRMTDEK